MTKITVSENYGNAPKKILLRDLTIAFAEDDVAFTTENITDDVEWTIVEDREIRSNTPNKKSISNLRGMHPVLPEVHQSTERLTGSRFPRAEQTDEY